MHMAGLCLLPTALQTATRKDPVHKAKGLLAGPQDHSTGCLWGDVSAPEQCNAAPSQPCEPSCPLLPSPFSLFLLPFPLFSLSSSFSLPPILPRLPPATHTLSTHLPPHFMFSAEPGMLSLQMSVSPAGSVL